MLRTGLTLALLLLSLDQRVVAQEHFSLIHIGECDANKQSNAAYTTCLFTEFQKLEPVLDRYVEAQREGLRAAAATSDRGFPEQALRAALEQFDSAQASWLQYREAHCTMVEMQFTTGTGAGAARNTCQIRLTRSRLHEIWADGWTRLPEPT